MTPIKLYLLRAVHDWAVDNGFTPQVLVDATAGGVKVPMNYVQDGRIVLNIHPRAVSHLEFAAEALRFSARFGGRSLSVEVPYIAMLAIYARENNQGITFPELTAGDKPDPGPEENPPDGKPPGKGPSLRVVK
ncbi:MAG: ClpXP protease specificity-enhancing factor [Gammaproteobacteria bacterium]|nr:ClpXP protease specificity-enhancing factor [Gammaproteobacteria bacterium]MDH5513489.1 ClpXP protease specificity-enhancing factor [Gammaproteobacteria bacterium]